MAATQDFGVPFPIYSDTAASDEPIRGLLEENVAQTEDLILESIEQDPDGGIVSRSTRNSSGPSGDEAIFDDQDARRSSSPASQYSAGETIDDDDLISQLPDEPPEVETRVYTSPFRKTSSVRAIQLNTTPPYQSPYASSPRSPRYKLSTPSRSGTPRSALKKMTPAKKTEYPLVLLHVTVLPVVMPCSLDLMAAMLPAHVVESYDLLKDKLNETVLQRGVLLPHPKDDYELLEERLLESLELRVPRILKSGHFHRADEECDGEEEEGDKCVDCGRKVKHDVIEGSGGTKWRIKIYAANGLMRAGAWTAAWREMERVDVEIEPWIPEELRRELEVRREEEEELLKHQTDAHDGEHGVEDQGRRGSTEEELRRLKEIYGEDVPHLATGGRASSPGGADEPVHRQSPSEAPRRLRRHQDMPLRDLLKAYLWHLASDRRNVAIAILSLLVLVMSVGLATRPSPARQLTKVAKSAPVAVASTVSEMVTPSSAVQQVRPPRSCPYPEDTGCTSNTLKADHGGQSPRAGS
ncbi:MAG: hypothetical protein M1832_003708 [Thelocarpon impressellum]|nr:MAG: hypothetical protein M1832_003708 [Thelocarpon impressellum]